LLAALAKHGFHRGNVDEVVCGGAVGPDKLGEKWALVNDVPVAYFPAQWNRYGDAAGPMRNRQMAEYADEALILWDGVSPDTRNMIKEMKRLNKPYFLELVDEVIESPITQMFASA